MSKRSKATIGVIPVSDVFDIRFSQQCIEFTAKHPLYPKETAWKERVEVHTTMYNYLAEVINRYIEAKNSNNRAVESEMGNILSNIVSIRFSSLQFMGDAGLMEVIAEYVNGKMKDVQLPEELSPEEINVEKTFHEAVDIVK